MVMRLENRSIDREDLDSSPPAAVSISFTPPGLCFSEEKLKTVAPAVHLLCQWKNNVVLSIKPLTHKPHVQLI